MGLLLAIAFAVVYCIIAPQSFVAIVRKKGRFY
jgi:hypothetical protein